MIEWINLIKSKAIKDYIISNNIFLDDEQKVEVIYNYTRFEDLRIKYLKHLLEESSDDELNKNIIIYCDEFDEFYNKFISNSLEYVYVVSEKYFKFNSTYSCFEKAYEAVKNMLLGDNYDTYCFIISKVKINEDDDMFDDITYARSSIDNDIHILHHSYYKDNDEETFDSDIIFNRKYIPVPFKAGDRIKILILDDIIEYDEDSYFYKYTRYNKDTDFWFMRKNWDNPENKYAVEICPTHFIGDEGIIEQINHEICSLMLEYEEDIHDIVGDVLRREHGNTINLVAIELQKLLRGDKYVYFQNITKEIKELIIIVK